MEAQAAAPGPLAARLGGLLSTPALMAWQKGAGSAEWASLLVAHAYELPLLHFSLDARIARQLPNHAPEAKLKLLRTAALEAGFEITQDGTCLRRSSLPEHSLVPHLGEQELTALRIPAAHGVLPAVEVLAARVDYLHALAELLGTQTVCPFSLFSGGGGQRSKQPLLYAGVQLDEGPDERPINDIASVIAGTEVRGDALLTSAEFRDSMVGELSCTEPCSVSALVAAVIAKSGEPAGFVAVKQGHPLLGSWTVPRTAAFLPPQPPPKAVLNEFLMAHPQHDITPQNKRQRLTLHDYPPIRRDGDPPRGFTGRIQLHWPAGVEPPPGATIVADDEISMVTQPQPNKKSAKKDRLAAEDVASQMMLDVLQKRIALGAAQPGASAHAGHTPPLRILEMRKPAPTDSLRALLPAGSRLDVSYALTPLAADALPPAVLPPMQAILPMEGGEVVPAWESREHESLLLGFGVLQPEVEELFSEMAAGERATAYARVELLRRSECWVALEVKLHARTLPAEERPKQLMFGLMGQAVGGVSHGEERLNYVTKEVLGWTDCKSVADIGCGEAKLLTCLVRNGADAPPLLLGVDATPRSNVLRRAGDRLAQARADVGPKAPEVALLKGGLADADVRADGLVLVEVIEHLDPLDLQAVGTMLLGQLAPRRMLVTTPNKEYNLNFMEIPDDQKPDAAGKYILPPLSSYGMRNDDHRFEWSREEFKAWANGLAEAHGYKVNFAGVGGGDMNEEVPHGEWRGSGPQTQVAIFERAAAQQPPNADFAAGLAATQMQIIWHSATEAQQVVAAMNAAAGAGGAE